MKLYISVGSPPVRAVQMCATALNIHASIDYKILNLLIDEHKTAEFSKINPQCTVPTLVDDDGFTVWDSHAIMTYLVGKYGKNDDLYSRNLKKRALIDQRLHFECGALFPPILEIMHGIVMHGKKTLDKEQIDWIFEMYGLLEQFLDGKRWMAGDSITIADYSIMSSVSSVNTMISVETSDKKWPNLMAWFQQMEKLPEYIVTKDSLDATANLIKAMMGK